jgi:small-conductance mechanosensitive channel|tara:strand:- start:152 stop:412 length:261 start_codon:yes stop_codon:yes gene_type:complete
MIKQYFYITTFSLAILLVAFLLFPSKERQNKFFEEEIEKIQEQRDALTAKEKELEKMSTEKDWEEVDEDQEKIIIPIPKPNVDIRG